jgi:hypothetical protein
MGKVGVKCLGQLAIHALEKADLCGAGTTGSMLVCFDPRVAGDLMKQGVGMQRMFGVILTAGLLSGCTPQLWSRSERHIACPCAPERAVASAVQAAIALKVTPIFGSDPQQFSVTLSNPDHYTVTKMAVAIKSTGAAMTEVHVQTESMDAAGTMDDQAATAFAEAFATASQ